MTADLALSYIACAQRRRQTIWTTSGFVVEIRALRPIETVHTESNRHRPQDLHLAPAVLESRPGIAHSWPSLWRLLASGVAGWNSRSSVRPTTPGNIGRRLFPVTGVVHHRQHRVSQGGKHHTTAGRDTTPVLSSLSALSDMAKPPIESIESLCKLKCQPFRIRNQGNTELMKLPEGTTKDYGYERWKRRKHSRHCSNKQTKAIMEACITN
jgi:hypothetical protein